MRVFDKGLYWVYCYSDCEWTVAEYYDDLWTLIGSDVTLKELGEDWFIGSKLNVPSHEPPSKSNGLELDHLVVDEFKRIDSEE